MTSKTNHWKLGLFVSAGATVGIGALLWLGASTLYQKKIRYNIFLNESVNGLDVGSPVRLRGVAMGSVAEIRFVTDRLTVMVGFDVIEESLVAAGLDPEAGKGPAKNFAAQLTSAGLTGGKYVAVDEFDPARFPRFPLPSPLPDGVDSQRVFPAVSSSLKNLEDAVFSLAAGLPDLFSDVDKLVEQLTALSTTADGLAKGEVRDLLANLLSQLEQADLGKVSQGITGTLDRVQPLIEHLDVAAGRLAMEHGPLMDLVSNVNKFVEQLDSDLVAANVPATAEVMRSSLSSAGNAADEAQALSREARSFTDDLRLAVDELRITLINMSELLTLLEREPSSPLRGRWPADSEPRNP